jgi:hypothetical protein
MPRKILLVNPPIYDFTAYDFWLRPLGLLRLGGLLSGQAQIRLFDFLDRRHPSLSRRDDCWARGKFPRSRIQKPPPLARIPRQFGRYGLARETFREFLREQGPFDAALVTSGMTYWYPGVVEVIEQLRRFAPRMPVALGGIYAGLCREHASKLEVDFLAGPDDLPAFWDWLGLSPSGWAPPFWQGYASCPVGVMTLSTGCPNRCSYCASGYISGSFRRHSLERCLGELEHLVSCGVRQIALYDDALLVEAEKGLLPFLAEARRLDCELAFHTPNALHSRLVTPAVARAMVEGGFESFFLGSESASDDADGARVSTQALAGAVENLRSAGAETDKITAYMIVGHPRSFYEALVESIRSVGSLGIRVMLAEFSPVPRTPDFDLCSRQADLSDPLSHNKTAWSLQQLGAGKLQQLKDLCRRQNRKSVATRR